jgi:hypothetical protein
MDPNSAANRRKPLPVWLLITATLLIAVGLVWFEQQWPTAPGTSGRLAGLSFSPDALTGSGTPPFHAGLEALKLVFAGLVGALISAVHRRHPGDKPISRSLAQAQILLCVAGALMMIIIGNSVARALGIAGGATIVRFKTPVDDPKDSTVLFILLGLGMACGLGELGVAGLGAAFLCVCLVLLDWIVARKPRAMMLEMVSSSPEFPADYVNRLLAAYQVRFEPREVNQHDKKATVRYHCTFDPDTPLQRLSEQLTDAQVGGLKSVSWETLKKE